MSVPPINMSSLIWASEAAGTVAGPWRVGDTVLGRVIENTLGARMILEIEGLTVSTNPPSAGTVPQEFTARVVTAGSRPVLEIAVPASPSSPSASVAPDLLRAKLPVQGSLQSVLADLHALSQATEARGLPAPVRQTLARLEASVDDWGDLLDPDLLRDAMQRSGVQLEHTMLNAANGRGSGNTLHYDFKAALQWLNTALQDTTMPGQAAQASTAPDPPPLPDVPLQPQARVVLAQTDAATTATSGIASHAQAALTRITVMQVATASPGASACMLEVPIHARDGYDVLQVRVRHERDDGDHDTELEVESAAWTLEFTVAPPALGSVQGQIRLRGEQVQVDLWAERARTAALLEAQMVVLPELLRPYGLTLGQVRVGEGMPTRHTGLGHRLLEVDA